MRAGPNAHAVPGLPRAALPGNRAAVPERAATVPVDQRFRGLVLPEVRRVAVPRGPGDAAARRPASTSTDHASYSRIGSR
jgi:hypothetical protein